MRGPNHGRVACEPGRRCEDRSAGVKTGPQLWRQGRRSGGRSRQEGSGGGEPSGKTVTRPRPGGVRHHPAGPPLRVGQHRALGWGGPANRPAVRGSGASSYRKMAPRTALRGSEELASQGPGTERWLRWTRPSQRRGTHRRTRRRAARRAAPPPAPHVGESVEASCRVVLCWRCLDAGESACATESSQVVHQQASSHVPQEA